MPYSVGPHRNIAIAFGMKKWCGYPMVKSFGTFSHFDSIPVCDRQMDEQTSCNSSYSTVRAINSIVQ